MNDIIVIDMNLAGDLCIIVSIFHKDMSEIHKKTIIGHVKCNPTWILGNWRKENKEGESYRYCGVSLGYVWYFKQEFSIMHVERFE